MARQKTSLPRPEEKYYYGDKIGKRVEPDVEFPSLFFLYDHHSLRIIDFPHTLFSELSRGRAG